jgi:hypothetical protein
MNTMDTDTWKRRGISFLWDAASFARLASPPEVLSLRAASRLSKAWNDELPANGGKALAVAGLDVCLDLMTPDDAEAWIDEILRPFIWQFQAEYDGEGALVFWIPGGDRRISMNPASEQYSWRCAPPFKDRSLAIGRLLLGGAESDAARIIDPEAVDRNPDGPAWIGLHHPRIS